jgi:XTP/dITP diphosphohydrolase
VKLLLATRNRNKVLEIQRALDDTGWQLVTLSDIAGAPDVEEDGATFQDNALKKARSAARASGLWTLAEDSGLEVDALGGEPGVKSARYAGAGATDTDRIRKVLGSLAAVPEERRTARFRCVMCLVDPAGDETCFEGRCEGRIANKARGSAGFGYDPVFVPEGHDRTFAELGLGVKGKISHRARAMQQVIGFLRSQADPDERPPRP